MANTTADGGGGTSANTPNPIPVSAPVDGESSAVENLSTTQTNPDSAMQDHADLGSPSPLSGAYLLIVLPEPYCEEHKDIVLKRLHKALLSWDVTETQVDIDRELLDVATQAPQGEESKNGEKLVQLASDSLVIEILVHPEINTFRQCLRNLLASFTRHRHIIHMGYTLSGSGSWILQDGTFEFSEFLDIIQDTEVQRLLRVYDGAISLDIHCAPEGQWGSDTLLNSPVAKSMKIAVNPPDKLDSSAAGLSKFIQYMCDVLPAITVEKLLEPSDVVGNIRFSHPTLYVFPAGQGDAALFGISGFNILVDGGFGRKPCFWDFARHMDRLDAVLMTRANMSSLCGLSSAITRKAMNPVYPQMGHVFCNIPEVDGFISPEGLKDKDPLIVHVMDVCQVMANSIKSLHMTPQPAYRENSIEPINLYHKVGHGTLDMYVISPQRDSKEVKEFLHLWKLGNAGDLAAARGTVKLGGKEIEIPLLDLVSICALVVWQPADPTELVTRILFPGSAPQQKILEGFEKLRHLDFLKIPTCTGSKLAELPPTKAKVKPAAEKSEKKITATPRPVSETVEVKHVKSVSAAPKKLDLEEKLNKINEAKSAGKTDSRETISKTEKKEKENERVKEAAKPAKKPKATESNSSEDKPATPRPKTEVKSRVDSNLATAKADSMELKKKTESKPISKPKPPAEKAAATPSTKKEATTEVTPKTSQIAPKIKKEVANMKVAEAKVSTTKTVAKKAEEVKKKPEKPAAEDKDKETTKAAEKPKKKVRSKSKEKKSEEKEITPKIKATETPKAAKPKPKPAEVKEKPVKVKVETKKESTPPKEAKKEAKEKPKAAKPPAAAAPAKPKEVKSKDTKAAEKKKTDAKPSAGSTQAKAVKRPPKPIENGTAAAAAAAAAVVVATAAGISAAETVADIAQETAVEEVFMATEAPEAASAPPAAAAEVQENGEVDKVSLVEAVEADIVADEVEMDKTDEKEEEEEEKTQERSIDDVLEHETSTEDIKEHEISTEDKVREDAEEVEDDEEKESTLSEDDLAKNDDEKEEVEVDEEKEVEVDDEKEVEVDDEKEVEVDEEKEVEVDEEKEVEVDEEKEVGVDDEKEVEVDEEKEVDDEKETADETEVDGDKEHEVDDDKKHEVDDDKKHEVDVEHDEHTEERTKPAEEDKQQPMEEIKQEPVVEEVKEKTGLFSKLEKAVTELKEVIGDALAKKGEKQSQDSKAAEETTSKAEAAEVTEFPETETEPQETIDLDFRQTVPTLKGDVEDIVDHAEPATQKAAAEAKETRDVEEKDVDEIDDKLEHEDAERDSVSSVHEEFQAEIITKDYVQESFQDTTVPEKVKIPSETSHETLHEVVKDQPTHDKEEDQPKAATPELVQDLQDQPSEGAIAAKKQDEVVVKETVTQDEQHLQDQSQEHEISPKETGTLEITDVSAGIDDDKVPVTELEKEISKAVVQQELEEAVPVQETTFSSEIHVAAHKEQKLEDSHVDVDVKASVPESKAAGESVPETKEEPKPKDLSPKEQNLEEIQAAIEITGRKLLEDIVPHHEESLSTPELSPVVQKDETVESLSSTSFEAQKQEEDLSAHGTVEPKTEEIPQSQKDPLGSSESIRPKEEVLKREYVKTPEPQYEDSVHEEQTFLQEKAVEVESAKVPEHHTGDDDNSEQVLSSKVLEIDVKKSPVPQEEEGHYADSTHSQEETMEHDAGKVPEHKEQEEQTCSSYSHTESEILESKTGTRKDEETHTGTSDIVQVTTIHAEVPQTVDTYDKISPTDDRSSEKSVSPAPHETQNDYVKNGVTPELSEPSSRGSDHGESRKDQSPSGMSLSAAFGTLQEVQAQVSAASSDKHQQLREEELNVCVAEQLEYEQTPVSLRRELSSLDKTQQHSDMVSPSQQAEIREQPIKEALSHDYESQKAPVTPLGDLSQTEQLESHHEPVKESLALEEQHLDLEQHVKEDIVLHGLKGTAAEAEDLHKTPLTPRSDVSSESFTYEKQQQQQLDKFESLKLDHTAAAVVAEMEPEDLYKAPLTPRSDVSSKSLEQKQQLELQQHDEDEHSILESKFTASCKIVTEETAKPSAALQSDIGAFSHISDEQQHVDIQQLVNETLKKEDFEASKLETEEERIPVTPASDTSIQSSVYEQQLDLQQHIKEEIDSAVHDSDKLIEKIEAASLSLPDELDLQQHAKEDATASTVKTEVAAEKPVVHSLGESVTPRSNLSEDSYTYEEHPENESCPAALKTEPYATEQQPFEVQQHVKAEAAAAAAKFDLPAAKQEREEERLELTPHGDSKSKSDHYDDQLDLQQHKDDTAVPAHKPETISAQLELEPVVAPPSPRSDVSADSYVHEEQHELQQHTKNEPTSLKVDIPAPDDEVEKDLLTPRSDVSAKSCIEEQQHKEAAAADVPKLEEKLEKLPTEQDNVPVTPRSDVSGDSYAFDQQPVKEETFSATFKTDILTAKAEAEEEKVPVTPRSDISVDSFGYEQPQQHSKEAAESGLKLDPLTAKLEAVKSEAPLSPRSDISTESLHYEQQAELQQHAKEQTFTAAHKPEVSAAEVEAVEERKPTDSSLDSDAYEQKHQHDLQQHAKEVVKTVVDKVETLAAKLEIQEEKVPASPRSDASTETYSYEHQLDLQQPSAYETVAAAQKTEVVAEAGKEKAPASPLSDITFKSYSYEQQQSDLQQHSKEETTADALKIDTLCTAAETKEEPKSPLTPRSDVNDETRIHEQHQQLDLQQHGKQEATAASQIDTLVAKVETDEENVPLTPRSDISVESYEQHQQLESQQHIKEENVGSHEIEILTLKPESREEITPLTPRSDVSSESYVEEQQFDLQQHIKEEITHKTETLFSKVERDEEKASLTPRGETTTESDIHEQLEQPVHSEGESSTIQKTDKLITKLETEEDKVSLTLRSDTSSSSYVHEEQQQQLQQHSEEETYPDQKTETVTTKLETNEEKVPLIPRSDISVESYDQEQQHQQPDLHVYSKEETATSLKVEVSPLKLEHDEEKVPLTPRSDISVESHGQEQQQQLDLHLCSKETAALLKTEASPSKLEHDEDKVPLTPRSDTSVESFCQEQQHQKLDLHVYGKEETATSLKVEVSPSKPEHDEEKVPLTPRSDISVESYGQQQQQQLDLHIYNKEETAASLKTEASPSKPEYEEEKVSLTPRSDISVEAYHYEQHFKSQQHAKDEIPAAAHKSEFLTGKAEHEDIKAPLSPRGDSSADSSLHQQHPFELQQHSHEETVAVVHKPEALATKSEDCGDRAVSPRSDISGDSYIYEKQQHGPQQHAKVETAATTTKTDTLGDKNQQDEHQPPPSPRSDMSSEPHSLEPQQQLAKQEADFTASKQDTATAGLDREEDTVPVTPHSDISTESSVYDRRAKEEVLPAVVAPEALTAKAGKEAEKAPLTPRSDISGDSYVYEQQIKKETGSIVQKLETGAAQLDPKEEQLPVTPRSDISAVSYSYEQRQTHLESDSKDAKHFETEVSSQLHVEEDSAVLKSGSEAAWHQSSEQFPASAYSYNQDYDRDLERREYYPEHPAAADYSATYTEEYTATTETEDWQHYGHEQDSDPNYRYDQQYDESYQHAYDDSYGYEDPYAGEYPEEHGTDSTAHSSLTSTQVKESDPARKDNTDPLSSWGKPLGLPAPIPPVAINGHDSRKSPHKKAKTAKPQEKQPQPQQQDSSFYVDLAYVPHHANPDYSDADFFKRIKARHYVLSALEPSTRVLNALVEAKESWSGEDKDLDVTIIPTYDSDALGLWVSANEETLARNRIDLAPSASRCTINLQDHETACSAYRLEF